MCFDILAKKNCDISIISHSFIGFSVEVRGWEWRWKSTFSTWNRPHDEPAQSFDKKSAENEAPKHVLHKTFEIIEKY